jgi:hypothetical protein
MAVQRVTHWLGEYCLFNAACFKQFYDNSNENVTVRKSELALGTKNELPGRNRGILLPFSRNVSAHPSAAHGSAATQYAERAFASLTSEISYP